MAKEVKADWMEVWKNEYKDTNKALLKKAIDTKAFNFHITPCKYSFKRIVEWLICAGTPFVVKNLGAGYKRITAVDKICTECKGTGIRRR
jgi:hypothetical protein